MGFDDEDHPFFHRKSKYDLNSKIMLTAIISLSIVVFFVSLLHIYARCVLRRQARRRAALQHLSIITSAAQVEPPKTGLDPSIIASLPIFVFKQNDHIENNSIECTVCLSVLENGETVRILPNCKHIFHAECIDKWFGTHSTCPICRTEAEPRLLPEPREGVVGRTPPSAPPLDCGNSNTIAINMEGMIFSDCGLAQPSSSSSAKISGSSSRLSSFRRMLSRDKSSRRIQVQSCGTEDGVNDLERQ
ncbi:E3 ubiquitin-protein ligase ATL41-like [Lycium ferocissimum]|uniref:E3 ubiquitin-protein ligase ATL41-like n=1 Tax=Lycium ferocissimum TaxID=112874 RepID=UPI002815695F|nr:E3 ubiquitin-protein ligase ATL41-like [Lycium ferocissimum]